MLQVNIYGKSVNEAYNSAVHFATNKATLSKLEWIIRTFISVLMQLKV